MVNRFREYLPATLNLLTATIIMIISFSNYFKFSIASVNAKLVGIIIVYVGMGIFVWASFYLKRTITGMIQPRLDNLVTNGSYKYCCHPVYFGIQSVDEVPYNSRISNIVEVEVEVKQ